MILIAIPIVIGLLLGWLRGGRTLNLVDSLPNRRWLLGIAVALQFAQYRLPILRDLPDPRWHRVVLAIIFGLTLAWLLLGLRPAQKSSRLSKGLLLLLLGLALNALPIAINGQMPFRPEAAIAAGIEQQEWDRPENNVKNLPADDSTRLLWLGDIIPIRPLQKVVSVGDIVIASAISMLIAGGMVRGQGDTISFPAAPPAKGEGPAARSTVP